jgi:hypothetical protein
MVGPHIYEVNVLERQELKYLEWGACSAATKLSVVMALCTGKERERQWWKTVLKAKQNIGHDRRTNYCCR